MINVNCHRCNCELELKEDQQIPLCEQCCKEVLTFVKDSKPTPKWKLLYYEFRELLFMMTQRFLIVKIHIRNSEIKQHGVPIKEVYKTEYWDFKYNQFWEDAGYAYHHNFFDAILCCWILTRRNKDKGIEFRIQHCPKENQR